VLIGGTNCAGNGISGPVQVNRNTGGVSFVGSAVHGPVTITGNSGGFTTQVILSPARSTYPATANRSRSPD
jgi:hypothetical protein